MKQSHAFLAKMKRCKLSLANTTMKTSTAMTVSLSLFMLNGCASPAARQIEVDKREIAVNYGRYLIFFKDHCESRKGNNPESPGFYGKCIDPIVLTSVAKFNSFLSACMNQQHKDRAECDKEFSNRVMAQLEDAYPLADWPAVEHYCALKPGICDDQYAKELEIQVTHNQAVFKLAKEAKTGAGSHLLDLAPQEPRINAKMWNNFSNSFSSAGTIKCANKQVEVSSESSTSMCR